MASTTIHRLIAKSHTRLSALVASLIHFGGRPILERLVEARLVVCVQKLSELLASLTWTVIVVNIDMLIRDCAPEPFGTRISSARPFRSILIRTFASTRRFVSAPLVK